jgi:hypothetical protein
MSTYPNSRSDFDAMTFFDGDALRPFASETPAQREAEKHAVDYALRNVQLPDGLLTRLRKLVYSIPDDSADCVDWLGC